MLVFIPLSLSAVCAVGVFWCILVVIIIIITRGFFDLVETDTQEQVCLFSLTSTVTVQSWSSLTRHVCCMPGYVQRVPVRVRSNAAFQGESTPSS
jgi:hypothetical protein